jgi:hypothetical protein
MSALDTQVGGEHYRAGTIQPVQFIESNKLAFLEGCVVKRVTRHDKPTGKGRQDIEKAIHELQLLLELRYGTASGSAGWERPDVTKTVRRRGDLTGLVGVVTQFHFQKAMSTVAWRDDTVSTHDWRELEVIC